jgi:hypothetical protein
MYATGSRGQSPAFLQPQNGNSHRSSGYVPGKVVPLRPPPPPKSQASAKFTSIRQEARASFAFSPEEQQTQRESRKQKRHKNTFICFAITSFSFFVALAVILGITSKYAPDGKYMCVCAHNAFQKREGKERVEQSLKTFVTLDWLLLTNIQ